MKDRGKGVSKKRALGNLNIEKGAVLFIYLFPQAGQSILIFIGTSNLKWYL
jgi:hypothetical protein